MNFDIRQRQIISKKYKKRNNFLELAFVVKVPTMNDWLHKYLMNRTAQFLNIYTVLAVIVEDTKKMYITRADWAQGSHYFVKRELEKVLKDYIERK